MSFLFFSHLESDSDSCPKPNKHVIITSIQARVSFLQSAPYGVPTLSVHTERNECAPLGVGNRVIFGVRVLPLWNTAPVLATANTYVRFLCYYYRLRYKVKVRSKAGGGHVCESWLTDWAYTCGKETLTLVPEANVAAETSIFPRICTGGR